MSKDFKYSCFSSCIFLSVFFILVFNVKISAAEGEPKPDLKFHQIYEGLVSTRILAVYQDRLGYMWFGTYNGLHRYDGIEFHIYSSDSTPNSINDNLIGDIYEDIEGHLWIATGNGMARYNRNSDDFTRFILPSRDPAQSGEINLLNTILEDNNGKMWVSRNRDGLFYFDRVNQQFMKFGDFENLNVNGLAAGPGNTLWLGTSKKGLAKVNSATGEVEFFMHEPSNPASISSSSIYRLIMDSGGNLWIGTRGSGLNRMVMENGQPVFYHYLHEPGNPKSLGNNVIHTFYIDRSENLWVGNDNGGLHLYDKITDSFFRYDSNPDDPYSLSHNSIWSIFQDFQERYWIGTAQSGINVADRYQSKFIHYYQFSTSVNSLNTNIIRDFLEKEDGNIWVATDGGGLNLFDRQQKVFTYFRHKPDDMTSLRSDVVISMNEDNDGTLWIGTYGGGLNILLDEEKGIFTSFNEMYQIYDYPIMNVFDVHFDEEYIWIAVIEEGLYRFNKKTGELRLFSSDTDNPESLSSNFVWRIFEDSSANLWIATFEGLNLLIAKDQEQGIFRTYFHNPEDPHSIPANTINQIFEDKNQTVWFATTDGLSKFVKGENRFENYYKSDGLPSDEVRSIIDDEDGNLWIGTINGISKFNPDNETFINFDRSDGLQGNEFSRSSVYKTRNGELLFGGLNGFNLFHPENIVNNPNPPIIYLTDLKLFNKSVDVSDPESPLKKHISMTDTLVLSYDQNVITFEFIALNYTQPEYNQYAYMIEGFEDNWNYVGKQRNATYTNLIPGEYIFRVKASNNDGIWNEEGVSIRLIITPPFWQTVWFYILAGLLMTALTVTIYRLRVRSIQNHNRQLEQQVAERTNDIEEKNKDLQETLKELEETKDELVDKAHKAGMADIATGVIHNVGNILNSVSISAELIQDSVKKSKMKKLIHANTILRENINQIEEFISRNPKGKKLMEYYLALETPLKNEQANILEQSERLRNKINLISEVITAQEIHVGADIYADKTSLMEMIDNALTLEAGSIEKHGLVVEKELQVTDPIIAQRSKLIHVLVNLFKNAKESMADNTAEEKIIIIKTWQNENQVYLSITDNGTGIKPENLNKIFTHGFTTKKNGHGFGLHNCANSMKEMGGKIEVKSEGIGKGATFIMSFPAVSELALTTNECIS